MSFLRNMRRLALQADNETDHVKRSVLRNALIKRLIEGEFDKDTGAIGKGPVDIDVDMARNHGWTDQQIERAWAVIEAVAEAEGQIAQANNPELYRTTEDGDVLYVGE